MFVVKVTVAGLFQTLASVYQNTCSDIPEDCNHIIHHSGNCRSGHEHLKLYNSYMGCRFLG